MALKITKVNLPTSKYGIKCPYKMTPIGVTIHNTSNDGTAMNEISYMQRNNKQVSFHYAVDDTRAVQGIPTNRNAWHAGDGNGNGNRKTISIEICYSKSGGTKFDKAEKNAAKLAAILLHQYGWGVSKLYTHKHWSGKDCPHRTLDKGWTRFKNMVQKELDAIEGKKPAKPSTSKPTKKKLEVDGYFGKETIKATQKYFKTTVDGIISKQPKANKKYLVRATVNWQFKTIYKGGSVVVRKMQKLFGVEQDGYFGKNSVKGMQRFLNKKGYKLEVDGYMGVATVKAWQKYLNKVM